MDTTLVFAIVLIASSVSMMIGHAIGFSKKSAESYYEGYRTGIERGIQIGEKRNAS